MNIEKTGKKQKGVKVTEKSILARILSGGLAVIIVSVLAMGVVSGFLNIIAANTAAETSFEQIVNASAMQVEGEIERMSSLVNEIAANTLFQDAEITDPYVSQFLKTHLS